MNGFFICILVFLFGIGLNSCSDNEINSLYVGSDRIETRVLSEISEFYYYYKGKKVYIPINLSKRYVVVKQNAVDCRKLSHIADSHFVSSNTVGYIVNVDDGQKTTMSLDVKTLNALSANQDVVAIEYVVGDSILVPISNIFYVKLEKLSDIALLEQETKAIGVNIDKAIETDELWIRLLCTKESTLNSLEASNYLYETGLFADVDPGFIFNFQVNIMPSDTYYSSQWGLNLSQGIQAEKAWYTTMGSSSITVATIDVGIYTQHSDLLGRMHAFAYNCDNGSSSPAYGNHGTMCAGIIAANHNNIAIAGIAPNVKLMNISSSLSNSRVNISEELANGINKAWQNGADIINNSWGDHGGAFYNNLHSSLLESSIKNALTKGRNGKGCVVCFASGNEKKIDYPAYCNPDIMVVGAIDMSGEVASFSGCGNELDVVAPGVNILSLNASGGTMIADGTSFAAPHISGIAALVFSVNPNLTQKQVSTIITETTGNRSWSRNRGWGVARASYATKVASGSYSISNREGSSVYANAKFYIPELPKSAIVQWGTSKNIATVLKCTNDTIEYRYDFSGRNMKDEIKATIIYCGMVSNISYPITVFNEPIITAVEQIYYSPDPNRIDMKVCCTDPNAKFTWSGSYDYMDFPYLGDASFMEYPNCYKSLYVREPGIYLLTVRADNQYAYDIYNFQISKKSFDYKYILPSDSIDNKTIQ